MQHGLVPNRHIVTNGAGIARVSMQYRPVLGIAASAQSDGLIVTAQHGTGPNTAVGPEFDAPNDDGLLSDKSPLINFRGKLFKLVNGQFDALLVMIVLGWPQGSSGGAGNHCTQARRRRLVGLVTSAEKRQH